MDLFPDLLPQRNITGIVLNSVFDVVLYINACGVRYGIGLLARLGMDGWLRRLKYTEHLQFLVIRYLDPLSS